MGSSQITFTTSCRYPSPFSCQWMQYVIDDIWPAYLRCPQWYAVLPLDGEPEYLECHSLIPTRERDSRKRPTISENWKGLIPSIERERIKKENNVFCLYHFISTAFSSGIIGETLATPSELNGAVIFKIDSSFGASKIASDVCLPMMRYL